MEPRKVIKSIDDKMGFTPEIMNMMNVIFITSGAPGVASCRRALRLLEGKEGASGAHGCMPGRGQK